MQLRELARPDAMLRYGVAGQEDGAVVILLHGAALDHHAWDPQVESLRHRYRLVAPDLRGHGDSVAHDGFTFAAAVADIVALLEILPDRPVALVGLSLGGNIAQEVVRQRPELVDALVVADSTCNTTPRHPLQTAAAITALTPLAFVPDGDFPDRAARSTATTEEAQRYVRAVTTGRTARGATQILVELLTAALRPERGYRVPVPTLLVHGARDRVGDIAAGNRAWARRDGLVEHAEIPDAGHLSNLDNPAAFTAALADFLDRTLPPPSPAPVPRGRIRALLTRLGERLRAAVRRVSAE